MSCDTFRFDDLSFTYPSAREAVFENLTDAFHSGDRIGVWGRNGSGKTTLLNVLAGYLRPSHGRVILDDQDIDHVKLQIALVSADFDMFDYLALEENMKFFLQFYQRSYDPDEVECWLARYELVSYRHRIAAACSRGTRKKLQIATSLILHPDILIADEPLDGLDEASRDVWFDDVRTFTASGGIAVFAIHDLDLLHAHTDRVIVLGGDAPVLAEHPA